MRLLVAGGAGFIGSNYVELHLDQHPDDSIRVLDKLTYAGRVENLAGLDENDPKSMARWMRKMGREMGDEFGGEDFDEMIDEMESGKDPDSGGDDGGSPDGGTDPSD